MKTSINGIELIKLFEGCSLKAYKCPAGVLTIGYGFTGNVRPDDIITKEEAEELLIKTLKKFEDAVNILVKVPLNQNQFDALVSFTYNCSINSLKNSTLLKLINKHDFIKAADEFLKWNKANGKELAGLTRRREIERKLFLKK